MPREKAIAYLGEFGAWEDLETASQKTLAQRVLWLACGDISDGEDWIGLIH